MNWVSGIVVYICVWWVVIFAVLPWGATPPDAPERGHDAGAPARPRLLLKAALTTVISFVIWLGIYALVVSDLISFRE